MTNLKRMEGETLCGSCGKPAAFQASTSRYGESDPIITGVLMLCDDCAGSLRYKLMIRQWDMATDGKWRLHGYGHPRWYKRWEGIEPEEQKKTA